jgi:DNA-directed RNA polymerase specialized sigma24 family protein
LEQLPEEKRLLLQKRYMDNRRAAEIAAENSMTPGAVRIALYRAAGEFRRHYERILQELRGPPMNGTG